MNQVPPVQLGILLAWFKLSLPVGDREDTVLDKNLSLRTESTGLSQRPLSIAREAATGRTGTVNDKSVIGHLRSAAGGGQFPLLA
jgi:hypothetical protein